MAQSNEQNKSPESIPQYIYMNYLTKSPTIIKRLNQLRKMMHEQNENIDKKIENFKKNQIKILELKNTINKLKFLVERFNSRLKQIKKSKNSRRGHLKLSN